MHFEMRIKNYKHLNCSKCNLAANSIWLTITFHMLLKIRTFGDCEKFPCTLGVVSV